MPLSYVDTYNIYDLSYAQLPTLEDAIEKGYVVDDERNRIEHVSVTSYPSLLFPALKNIKREHSFFSTSHIERIGLLYGISLLQEDPVISDILEINSRVTHESEDEEVLRSLDVIAKLDYSTPSRCDNTSISILAWCREWINSNSWILGLSKSQLCVYTLLYGLSKYTYQNKTISNHIAKETEHFQRYLNNKHTGMIEL